MDLSIPRDHTLIHAPVEVMIEIGNTNPDTQAVSSNKYKQIFGIREIHLLSLFALICVGVEVTIGGWSVTYVQEKRHGTSSAGYISSGFFGGLMLGRIFLMWLNRKVSRPRNLVSSVLITSCYCTISDW